jgi:hypothetical protein
MMDGTAATHAMRELDAVRSAIDEGRYDEAGLRIELLEREIAGRGAVVVDIWRRLLEVELARIAQLDGRLSGPAGESRPA